MHKIISVLYVSGGIFFLIIFTINIFKKAEIHFRFIKYLEPKKLEGINSYFHFSFNFRFFSIELLTLIWLWTPIYYNKIDPSKLDQKGMEYHNLLLKNRQRIILSFIIYLFWIAGIGFLIR